MSTSFNHPLIPHCFHDQPCNDDLHEGATVSVPAGERLLMPVCRTNSPYDWGDLSPQELIELVYLRSFEPEFQPPPESRESQRGEELLRVAMGDQSYLEPHDATAWARVMEQRQLAYETMLRHIARFGTNKEVRHRGKELAQGLEGTEDVMSVRGKDIQVVRKSVFGERGE